MLTSALLLFLFIIPFLKADKCEDTCIRRCYGYYRGETCGPKLQAITGLNNSQCEQACQNNASCSLAEYGYSMCRLYDCSDVRALTGYQVFRKCTTANTAKASTSSTKPQNVLSSTTTSTTSIYQISSKMPTETPIFAATETMSVLSTISYRKSPANTTVTIVLTKVHSDIESRSTIGTSDTITIANSFYSKLVPTASIKTVNDLTPAGTSMSTANMESKSLIHSTVSKSVKVASLSKILISSKHTYSYTLSSLSSVVWSSKTEHQSKSLKDRLNCNRPPEKSCCVVSMENVSVFQYIVVYIIWWLLRDIKLI